jgi:hypothetical protein
MKGLIYLIKNMKGPKGYLSNRSRLHQQKKRQKRRGACPMIKLLRQETLMARVVSGRTWQSVTRPSDVARTVDHAALGGTRVHAMVAHHDLPVHRGRVEQDVEAHGTVCRGRRRRRAAAVHADTVEYLPVAEADIGGERAVHGPGTDGGSPMPTPRSQPRWRRTRRWPWRRGGTARPRLRR